MSHLQGPFYLLLGGLAISTLVFLFELRNFEGFKELLEAKKTKKAF